MRSPRAASEDKDDQSDYNAPAPPKPQTARQIAASLAKTRRPDLPGEEEEEDDEGDEGDGGDEGSGLGLDTNGTGPSRPPATGPIGNGRSSRSRKREDGEEEVDDGEREAPGPRRTGPREDVEMTDEPGGGTEGDVDSKAYCTCRQVSYGEMIGCDDDDCEIEWVSRTADRLRRSADTSVPPRLPQSR